MQSRTIPYVLSKSDPNVSWLDYFSWPVNPKEISRVNDRAMSRFNLFVGGLSHENRNLVLLARGINESAALIEAALIATSSTSSNIENIIFEWIRNGDVEEKDIRVCVKRMGDRFRLQKIPCAKARQIVRIYSWSGLSGLMPSLIAPNILAVTHNPLLVAEAKRQDVRMSYAHAELLFQKYVAQSKSESSFNDSDLLQALAGELSQAMMADEMLVPALRRNMEKLFFPYCYRLLTDAAKALHALKQVKVLPNILWTGNGSYYASRAIGLEVIRRGGSVRRFDHGGTASLLDSKDYLIQQELAVSTEFVLPTRMAASLPVINEAAQMLPNEHSVSILYGCGDPSLRPVTSSLSIKRSGRLKIMFIGTAYYGFYQSFPPFLPAPLYLEWQRRLLKLLSTFDIDLVHKPHPGGVFMGCPPALENLARIENRRFENAIQDFDILMFDFAASTTFSLALCSDKPIILLDFGSLVFQHSVKKAIADRCTVVDVGVDERNRLSVDNEFLRQAVCRLHRVPDPTYFRKLFLGGRY
jgi:hypothetical protein